MPKLGAGNADFVNNKESRDRAVNSIVTQLLGEGGKQFELKNSALLGTNSKDWNACEYARKKATVTAWNSYLEIYPQGECASEAKDAIDDIACNHAERTKTIEGWQLYLKHQPKGNCAVEAKGEIKELQRKYIEKHKIGNLIWSDWAERMPWSEAVNYCKNLSEGGFDDWRLPNIDELRTLIKDRRTVAGGACKVSERSGCLSKSCWSWETCAEACDHNWDKCTAYDDGRYSKFGDTGSYYWSSSVRSDNSNNAWGVSFNYGLVYNGNKYNYYVRCVR